MTALDYTNIQVGVMNYIAYGFAFIKEILGYIFNLSSGWLTFSPAADGQIVLGGALPTLTDKGEDIVGALMTIVHNGIVFAAEFTTLLPANALT